MQVDWQTDKQTNGHTHHSTLHPSRGWSNNVSMSANVHLEHTFSISWYTLAKKDVNFELMGEVECMSGKMHFLLLNCRHSMCCIQVVGGEERYLQYCTVCLSYKAPRSHHCHKCQRWASVLKYALSNKKLGYHRQTHVTQYVMPIVLYTNPFEKARNR